MVNPKDYIKDKPETSVMASTPPSMIDDLFKEFKKYQKGNADIQQKLNTIQTTVDNNTASINTHIKTYSEEIQLVNGKVNTLQDTVNNLEKTMTAMSDEVKVLKDENLKLRKRLHEAEKHKSKMYWSRRRRKRRSIIIDGIKEAPFRKTKEIVTELCLELGIELSPLTVVNMYRLGQQKADASQSRPVKVKFHSNLTKQLLYKNIFPPKDSDKWSRVSIRDDVTEETQNIQRDLRAIAASARSQGIRAQVRGKVLVIEDKRYSHGDYRTTSAWKMLRW